MTPTPTDERPICPICNLRISDKDFHYDGCDIMMHRHCDKEISKTPTPEEVINNVIKETGYAAYKFENILDRLSKNTLSSEVIIGFVFKAMLDYAEVLYTERIKQGASELPTRKDFIKWMEDTSYSYEDSPHEIYDWMKQAASLVIAKEREKAKGIVESLAEIMKSQTQTIEQKDKEVAKWKEMYNNVNNKDSQTISGLVGELQKKEKEIEELKKDREHYHSIIFKTTNTKTK